MIAVYILGMFGIEYAKCMAVDSVVGGHIKSSKKFSVKKKKGNYISVTHTVVYWCVMGGGLS